MIYVEPGLYVRIEQRLDRPHPLPLSCGFSADMAYRTLGIYNPSETGEAYLILANDRDEAWFISNRHVRVVGLDPDQRALRYPLQRSV